MYLVNYLLNDEGIWRECADAVRDKACANIRYAELEKEARDFNQIKSIFISKL